MMREQPGLSESYSAGNAKYTERMFLTKGALLALESTGTTWKHHSGNSDAFEKMLTSIKNYHQALRAYGEGNKQPLSAMLSIALRKTGREIKSRPVGKEKAVMTEINARIKNMLERDPELKKYALRSGLKESELEPAPAVEAGSKNRNTTAEKSHENQIIIG